MSKKLYLASKEEKKLIGVCYGIAKYFDIDVTIVRVVWVLLTLFPPFPFTWGILTYIICGLVIPKEN